MLRMCEGLNLFTVDRSTIDTHPRQLNFDQAGTLYLAVDILTMGGIWRSSDSIPAMPFRGEIDIQYGQIFLTSIIFVQFY